MAKIGPNGRVLKAVKKEPEKQPEPPKPPHKRDEGIDIMGAFTQDPPDLDFVLPGFLRATVGALVAPGATGKSWLALQAAMAVACGSADLLGLTPAKTGKVLYLAGEDPEPAIIRRLHALGAHLKPEAKQGVAENLRIRSIMGQGFNIMKPETLDYLVDDARLPPDELMDTMDSSEMFDHRLIVFDTLSRIHTLDENSNGDMGKLLAKLETLAYRTQASVLFLHHVNKGSAREGQTDQQHAARGASLLIDNARWCGFVAKMSPDEAAERRVSDERRPFYIRYGVSKQNYSSPIQDIWLKRVDGGVLLPADDLPEPEAKPKRKNAGDNDYVAAKQGIKREKV